MKIKDEVELIDLIELLKEYWDEFRNKLLSEELAYNDIENIKKTRFINRFEDAISNSEQFALCNLSDINIMLRSCKGKQFDKSRFIPLKKGDVNWEINEEKLSRNRYNLPEKGFMYLGVDKKQNPKTINDIKKVCLHEIRAFDDYKDEFVSTLRFKYTYKCRNKKILDFSQISKYKTIDDIKKEIELTLNSYLNTEDLAQEYLMKIFLKLINDSVFKKVNKKKSNIEDLKEELKKEYAPFHAFANYLLEDKGYAGIIYISTVCDGLNLVLFDRDDVEACGEIVIDNIEKLKSRGDFLIKS